MLVTFSLRLQHSSYSLQVCHWWEDKSSSSFSLHGFCSQLLHSITSLLMFRLCSQVFHFYILLLIPLKLFSSVCSVFVYFVIHKLMRNDLAMVIASNSISRHFILLYSVHFKLRTPQPQTGHAIPSWVSKYTCTIIYTHTHTY